MLGFIIRRVLLTIPTALGVSIFVFSLVHLAGDPINALVPADASAETVLELRRQYGYDRPLVQQYVLWLWNAVNGDFGVSLATGQPVLPEVIRAVSNTLIIAVPAVFVGAIFGILLGSLAGSAEGRLRDSIASLTAVIGISLPHYWLAIVLVIIFAVQLQILPAIGMGAAGSSGWAWDLYHLKFMILPVITLSAIPLGIIARTVRGLVFEILKEEFVQALRARGLSRLTVAMHVAKNAAPTVLAILGLQTGYLLGGSILVETVFSWPGSGFLLNNAISRRDMPMLQGTILTLALIFVMLNLLVDILQTVVDPRIRRR